MANWVCKVGMLRASSTVDLSSRSKLLLVADACMSAPFASWLIAQLRPACSPVVPLPATNSLKTISLRQLLISNLANRSTYEIQ